MYLRFQVKSDVFADIVRSELRRSDAGCIEPGKDGIAVERLEFLPLTPGAVSVMNDDTAVTVRVAGAPPSVIQRKALLVTVPVKMVARTIPQWVAGVPEPNLTFTLKVQLAVDFVLVGSKVAPRVTYHGLLDDPTTPDLIEKAVDDRLRAGGIDRTLGSFDLVDKVFGLLQTLGGGGAPPAICWTGIALSNDSQTVEIRLELTTGDPSGTHDLGGWSAFFARQFDDRREGMDLAVAVPQELVVEGGRAQVAAELAKKTDFPVSSGPNVSWNPSGPGLHVTMSGTQIDACQCLWGEIDIDVDVAIDITIGTEDTPEGGNLVLDQRRDTDIQDDLAVVCCVITWPFDKLVSLISDIPDFVVDVLSLPLRTLTASWDQPGGAAGPPPPPDPCTQDPDDEDHKTCRYPLGLNPKPDRCRPQSLSIVRPRVRGFNDSLVLQAAAIVRELSLPVPVAGAVDPFVWRSPVKTCNGLEGQWEAVSHMDVTQGGGDLRLEVKAAIPVTPSGIFYKTALVGSPSCPQAYLSGVDIKVLPGAINGITVPGHMVLLTTGGNLMVELPVVPARDQAKVDQLAHDYPLWRVNNCYIEMDDWPGEFDPHWLVDPPPDELVSHQLWVIHAGGLQPGERVVVRHGAEVVATGVAGTSGKVVIEVVDQAEQLSIVRTTPTGEAMPGQRYGLIVKQVLLGEVGHQRTTVPILALAPGILASASSTPTVHVSALTTAALVTFSLGSVPPPHAISTADVVDVSRIPELVSGEAVAEGFVGLAANGNRLVVQRLATTGGRRAGPAPFWVEEVIDLTTAANGGDGARDQAGSARARRLVASSLASGLVAGPRGGVVVAEPRIVDEGRYGVDLGDGGFIVGGSAPEDGSTHYASRPWSDGVVRVGRTHVRLDDDRHGFRWFRVLDTATH
jgi:hypothetical protein